MGSIVLPPSGPLGLDADAIIYRVENIAPYRSLLQAVFDAGKAGTHALITSELSLLECLIKPVRDADSELEQLFRAVLTASREIKPAPISTAVLERALHLRARHGLKTPDAIHAATALEAGCKAFYTNDPVFLRVPGLGAEILDLVLERP